MDLPVLAVILVERLTRCGAGGDMKGGLRIKFLRISDQAFTMPRIRQRDRLLSLMELQNVEMESAGRMKWTHGGAKVIETHEVRTVPASGCYGNVTIVTFVFRSYP